MARPTPRLQRSVALLAAAVGAVLIAMVAYDLHHEYTAAVSAAEQRTENLARLLEEHARQTLMRIERSLGKASEETLLSRDPAVLQQKLRGHLHPDGLIRSFTLIDAEGKVIQFGGEALFRAGQTLAGRDFFDVLRGPAATGLSIGALLRVDAGGGWILPVGYRIAAPDGAFRGVLLAAIDPAQFQTLYDAIDTGAGGFVTLLLRQGRIAVRSPQDAGMLERDWSDSPLFRLHLPAAAAASVRQAADADGLESIYSYRALPDYPLVVSLGLSMADIRAVWSESAWRSLVVLFALLATLGAAVFAIRRQHARHDAADREIRRLSAIVEATSDWVLTARLDGQLTYMNPAARRVAGVGANEDVSRLRVQQFYSAEHWDFVQRVARPAALAEGSWTGEARVETPNGRMLDISQVLIPHRDDAGRPQFFTGISRDISMRKNAERRLRDSEARLSAFLQHSPSILFIKDMEGRYLHANAQFLRAFGLQAGTVIGRSDAEIFPAAQAEHFMANDARVLAEGEHIEVEENAVQADGLHTSVVAKFPIRDADGRIVALGGIATDITERRRAERALAEARARLEIALEGSGICYWDTDLRSREVSLSPGWAAMTGAAPGTTRSSIEAMLEQVHPEDAARSRAAETSMVKGDTESYSVERRFLTRDGAWKWIHSQGRVIERDAQGRAVRLFGTMTDISRRIERERELRRSNELLAETLEATADGILVVDAAGKILIYNRRFAEIWGHTSEILTAGSNEMAIARVLDQLADPEGFVARLRELDAMPEATSLDTLLLKDGRVIERYSAPHRIDGAVNGRVRSFRDISARVASQRELEREHRFLQQIIDAVPNFIYVRDREARYTLCNLALAAFCEREPEQMIGRTNAEIGRSAAEVESALRRDAETFALGRRVGPYESEHADAQGRRRWFENTKTPLFDADGIATQVLGVATEITQRKQAEYQLKTLNEDLERRVAERTAMLEASVNELESLIYTMSHDLRTPLRAIGSYAQILREQGPATVAPQLRAYLERLGHNAEFMARMVDQLLEFARVSRTPIERTRVDVEALVRELIDALPREGRDLRFTVGRLPACSADAPLLRQVYVELVSNAVKFTRPRPVAQIEIGCTLSDGAAVYFVRDNGAGFEMAYADKLFGVFQRLHGNEEFEGAGAGLAIVKRIVSRHGGRIWAEGEPGKGAVFYFTLGE